MIVSFDPRDEQQCAFIAAMLSSTAAFDAPPLAPETATTTPPPAVAPAPLNPAEAAAAAVVAPVPSAPVVEETPAAPVVAAPAATNGVGVDLDNRGVPWCEAVHAGNKSLKADGTWKKKRGVDDMMLATVEAQEKAKLDTLPVAAEVPVEQPAAPIATISMEQMQAAFQRAIDRGAMRPEELLAHYAQAGVDHTTLPTNETARSQFVAYLDALTPQ